jgi:hypothetical protein
MSKETLYDGLVSSLIQAEADHKKEEEIRIAKFKAKDEAIKEGVYTHLRCHLNGVIKPCVKEGVAYIQPYFPCDLSWRHDEAFFLRMVEEIMEETGRKFTLEVTELEKPGASYRGLHYAIVFKIPRPAPPISKEVEVGEKKMRVCSLQDDEEETWDSVSTPSQE